MKVDLSANANAATMAFPGLRWGDYPERAEPAGNESMRVRPRAVRAPSHAAHMRRVAAVRTLCEPWQALSQGAFLEHRHAMQIGLAREGLAGDAAELCCAFVVEAARRALGKTAFDGQVLAALAMLDNQLVEMATGEGKSLAVALAAAMGGLAGIPVHVLTANDYLVTRDAQGFRPLFDLLGLGVASVVAGHKPEQRRAAYAQAIVYVTAKELAFDYLRDRLLHGAGRPALQQRVGRTGGTGGNDAGGRLLRGLCMAIVDEADSILIDEAQTPLVLSREAPEIGTRAFLWQAYALSGRLESGTDFLRYGSERTVTLTDTGRSRIAALAAGLQPVWKNARHREDMILSALTARHVLKRDRDYVVTDPKPSVVFGVPARGREIAIVDATTGRIAEGRKWSGGLHALIALKENIRPDAELETLSRITFQRFFRRYHRLGGMSGTLAEARRELACVYGLQVVAVPPRLPNRREHWASRCFRTDESRWAAVVERTRTLSGDARPVLIGTDSVEASRRIGDLLAKAGIAHSLLNANFDADEARIVAAAGISGCVTVSTNMAGRGTDIVPDTAALDAGGLHVIMCQRNDSRRHDRQLAGRAARQGQRGSCEAWSSLQHAGSTADTPLHPLARFANAFGPGDELRLPARLLNAVTALRQRRVEARQTRRRVALLREETELEQQLAFSIRT